MTDNSSCDMRFFSTLLFAALLTACNKPPKEVRSIQPVGRLTIPGHWNETNKLNDEADVQVCNELREQYLIVLTEPKKDFPTGFNLEAFAKLTSGAITQSAKGRAGASNKTTINGKDAVMTEISGTIDGVAVFYLHTAVEGAAHFHQIIAWTTAELESKNRPILEQAIRSFRE